MNRRLKCCSYVYVSMKRNMYWKSTVLVGLVVTYLLYRLAAQKSSHDSGPPEPRGRLNITLVEPRSNNEAAKNETRRTTRGGEDDDPLVRAKREKVKEMFVHAWKGYKKYAWGYNELQPISREPYPGVFPDVPMGLTIVDALDTIWLMELDDFYDEAKKWIKEELSFNYSQIVSVFETTIRYVGGLLSMYAITEEQDYLRLALDVGTRLLPALRSGTGVPYGRINLNYPLIRWQNQPSLAAIGTLFLEFSYLSDVSGDYRFVDSVRNLRTLLTNMTRPFPGIYPMRLSVATNTFLTKYTTIGAGADSFFEYLLKAWLQSGKRDEVALDMYLQQEALIHDYLITTSPEGRMYFVDSVSGVAVSEPMQHLSCFAGSMFAMAATNLPERENWSRIDVAKGITSSCHDSYEKAAIGIGPEKFYFRFGAEAVAENRSDSTFYILRPEVVESYFFLWRATKDNKYREWGWDMVQALEKYCRVENGYSGIKNVNQIPPEYDDIQQSFFLAETLKYLYLLFSSDDLFPLDQWVFNTEAHPLPIKGVNPLY